MALMDSALLVPFQLSSLFASTHPIAVPTTQNYISDGHDTTLLATPPEHANHAAFFNHPATGTILLRVTHWGRVLELISLASDVPPLSLDFPSRLLPYPTLWLHSPRELCIIAVTDIGSLYRFMIPLREGKPSWSPQATLQVCREYVVQGMRGATEGIVSVQGAHCVIIHTSNGTTLRLERDLFKPDDDGKWKESRITNRLSLNPLSFLLTNVHGALAEGDSVVSMTSCTPPTGLGRVWTLTRDRTFRLWTEMSGWVFEKSLPPTAPGRSVVPNLGSPPNASKPAVLLPPDPRKLIYAWEVTPGLAHVIVFIPTESASTSGGFFHLYASTETTMSLLEVFETTLQSAHCHLQDFSVHQNILYTLWDRQGQSILQQRQLDLPASTRSQEIDKTWRGANYAEELELTPAYLDELLLASGSLTEKFFEAIVRPGVFSPLTLQTAIDQYIDACRSLPPPHPPQLLTTYANVGEQIAAVVGSTVKLTRDSQTGAPQYSQYWNALKRDWEGFIARCREVERSARRPLAIGFGGPLEGVLISERERVAHLAAEDLALTHHRQRSAGIRDDPCYQLLNLAWRLRTKLTARTMHMLESRVVDIVHQEIAFPFADIIEDAAQRMSFRDDVDEGLESWIVGRLEGIENIEGGVRAVLDVVAGFNLEVKKEDAGIDLHREWPQVSEVTRAFVASYITVAIHARYELCLSLMALLFFLSGDLASWNPSLLAEVFAVFRGVAMLRYVVRQPAGDIAAPSSDAALNDDDVVSRMRTMQVSGRHSGFTPTYSLIHRLVAQSTGLLEELPRAAHRWLDDLGLLQAASPAHALDMEVQFCEQLRLLGYREVAREVLGWLPRTPGVTYVLGRLWLDEGRFDDASAVMESLAGSFGADSGLSSEDMKALAAVLPSRELFVTEFDYHLHTAGLFKAAAATPQEVLFTQLAISASPPGVDTTSLWHGAIRGLTDLGLYEDAYASLVSTPYDQFKRDCISQLVYRMCEEDAVERLVSYNFSGLSDEVEDALSFKARNADPRTRPFYSRILYSWYVSKGDYRNAALTMYQRARKLATLIGEPASFINLAELQLEAYVISLSALTLIDQKNAWIAIGATGETEHAPRKRRKLSKQVPESRFTPGKQDVDIVELADIQYEYTQLSAQLELVRRDPSLLSGGALFLSPESLVLRLAQMNRFNMAIATARSLDVDMSDLFGHLAAQCLRLSHHIDAIIGEDTSDWLLTDKVSSWPGTPVDRGWRYLRQSLERHDGLGTDYRYTKVVLETILEHEQMFPPPPWLIHSLEVHHPEYLIRTCLRYDNLESALEHTLSLMRRSDARLVLEQPKTASAAWLPYTLIDQVLLAVDSEKELSTQSADLRTELRAELASRMKKAQKLSMSWR